MLQNKIKINKLIVKIIVIFTFFMFVFSEYFSPFRVLDKLHLKHYILWLGIIIMFFDLFLKNKIKIRKIKTISSVLISIFVLLFISMIFQLKANDFKIITIEEIYYLLIPLIFVFFVNFYSTKEDYDIYLNVAFFLTCFCYLVQELFEGNFNLNNLKIAFSIQDVLIKSYSPFESDCGQFFVVFFIFFCYKKKYLKAIFCTILIVLCAKRMNILITLFLWLTIWFFKREKKPKKILVIGSVFVFTIFPLIMLNMFTNKVFIDWFYNQYGVSLNKFTMTRVEILNVILDNNIINMGLGTTTEFLEFRNVTGQTNLHNDLLRIYLECGIFGLVIFNISYFILAKNNYSFILLFFVFVELIVAHFIGAGSITFWILIYLSLYFYNFDILHNKKVKN